MWILSFLATCPLMQRSWIKSLSYKTEVPRNYNTGRQLRLTERLFTKKENHVLKSWIYTRTARKQSQWKQNRTIPQNEFSLFVNESLNIKLVLEIERLTIYSLVWHNQYTHQSMFYVSIFYDTRENKWHKD